MATRACNPMKAATFHRVARSIRRRSFIRPPMKATLAERQFGDLVQVPTLPHVASRLTALIQDPEAGLADIGALTGDPAYKDALNDIWANIVDTRMHITGGLGAVHGIEGFGRHLIDLVQLFVDAQALLM